MKRFLKKTAVFAIIMVAVDVLAGFFFRALTQAAIGGDTARNEYMANEMDAELLFFGSSRCVHHYVPRIFEDSLGMTAYNCGNNGMGIIMCYARYKMICARYKPKVIIYDPLSGFDLQKGDNHSYLAWLRPYANHVSVDSVCWNIDETEKYKLKSFMYRYNGKILQMVTDCFVNMRSDQDGYRPLTGVMNYETNGEDKAVSYEIDNIKIYYLEKLMQECKENGIQLIFCLSPFYGGSSHTAEIYEPLLSLCDKYCIPFVDCFSEKDIVNNKDLFVDSYHMNKTGASMYCNKLVAKLKPIIYSK